MHGTKYFSSAVETFPGGGGGQANEEGGGFNPRKLLGILLRRWWIITGAGVIGALLGILWVLQLTPIYTATATLLIDVRRQRLMQSESVVSELALDANNVATELSLIQSFVLARRVVERLKLVDDPDFNRSPGGQGLLASIKSHIRPLVRGGGEAQRPAEAAPPPPADDGGKSSANGDPAEKGSSSEELSPQLLGAISAVQGGTQVQRLGMTWFIAISYSHPDPKVATKLTNAIADTYLLDQIEARYQAARRATGWLSERVSLLRQKVEASERAVAEHRAQHNLASLAVGTLSDQQAAAINADLVAAHADAVQKRSKYDQARGILEGGKIDTVSEVMASPTIVALRAADTQAAQAEADLRTRYGPDYPEVRKVGAQRSDIRRQISAEVSRMVAALKTDYELAQTREAALERSLKELTGATGKEQAMIRLRELEREAQADKALYESLLTRFKEAEQQINLPAAETRVVAPALEPSQPSYPNKQRLFLMVLAGGLMVGVGLAFLLEYIENGFTTMEEVEQALQLPVLAMIPQLTERERTVEGRMVSLPEYVALKPLSRFSENVRSVRVGAQMSNIDEPPRLLLVTSSAPSEGKTSMSCCLAYSAASGGQKVLAIDCDLRRPSLTRQFGLTEAPGLTDLLTGHAASDQVFGQGPLPNLTVLPAGATTRHPPDVLGSEKLRSLLKDLRASYDLIVLDAPPVTPVIDSALLSKLADTIIFVVQWRATPRDVVLRAVNTLDEPRRKVAGVVLNNVQLRSASTYSAAYGYYNKRYQSYYEG